MTLLVRSHKSREVGKRELGRQKTGEDVRGGWDGIARQKTGEEWDGRERKISIEGGGGARDLGRNIYAGGKGRSAGGPQVLKQRVPGAHVPTLVKRLLLMFVEQKQKQ